MFVSWRFSTRYLSTTVEISLLINKNIHFNLFVVSKVLLWFHKWTFSDVTKKYLTNLKILLWDSLFFFIVYIEEEKVYRNLPKIVKRWQTFLYHLSHRYLSILLCTIWSPSNSCFTLLHTRPCAVLHFVAPALPFSFGAYHGAPSFSSTCPAHDSVAPFSSRCCPYYAVFSYSSPYCPCPAMSSFSPQCDTYRAECLSSTPCRPYLDVPFPNFRMVFVSLILASVVLLFRDKVRSVRSCLNFRLGMSVPRLGTEEKV